ncbi:DUF2236 domain containing protein [Naviculisporaceae sp. PSN 640]
MASSRPKNGDYCCAYGFEFYWTADHLTPEQMRPLMFSYDVVATKALDVLDKLSPTSSSIPTEKADEEKSSASAANTETVTDISADNISAVRTERQDQEHEHDQEKGYKQQQAQPNEPPKTGHHRDLYTLLAKNYSSHPTLTALWDEVHTIPPWVDFAQIERGQRVFYRYAIPFVISLTFQSLLGGMGSSRISHTLSKTGGFSAKISRKRLLDTFQHVLEVTRDLESIKPGGKGFISSLRVRLLHASVRRRILLLAKQNAGYYNVEEDGVPISDLDSIATIITFSATVIFLGLPRQGIFLRKDEIQDYLALWRYIGYIMGTPVDEFFSTPEKAKALMESLGLWEIHPDETSCRLANNIISGLKNQPPTYASEDFLRAQAWWLNGGELATALKVPRPGVYYFALVAAQCALFMVFAYVRRMVPWLDERTIRRMKGLLERETLKMCGGKEATYGFKYIPRLGKETRRDEAPSREEEGELLGKKEDGKGLGVGKEKKREYSLKTGFAEKAYVVVILGVSAVVGGIGLWLGRGLVISG